MSDLQDVCAALAAIDGDILAMSHDLHGRAQRYSQASAQAAAAARRAEGEAAAALARVAAALATASRCCGQAATTLLGASREGQAYVQRTVGESRGSSDGAGVTVLDDDTSTSRSESDSPKQISALQAAFIGAHDQVTGKLDPNKFMALINPNFEGYADSLGDRPHNINCGLCAQAVALTLDGHPHIAGGAMHAVSTPEMAKWAGQPQKATNPNEIESTLRLMPPGSHAIIGVDYLEGKGHWFNAYWDGNQVWALDGQCGTCQKWPPALPPVWNWDIIYSEGSRLEWK